MLYGQEITLTKFGSIMGNVLNNEKNENLVILIFAKKNFAEINHENFLYGLA